MGNMTKTEMLPLFFMENKKKVDKLPKRVYNINIERRTAMAKKTKKKPTNWSEIVISALVDLIVGIILIIIDKYIG